MSKRDGDMDDSRQVGWSDFEDADDKADIGFDAAEFDADMIAAARLMPPGKDELDEDAPRDDDDVDDEDYESFADSIDGEDGAPTFDAELDEHDQAQQRRGRRAEDLFEQPKMRQALRAELARVVGARRASAAAQLFIRDYMRLLRKQLQSTKRKEHLAAADLLQATARRFAWHHLVLDEKSAERLGRRVLRILGASERSSGSREASETASPIVGADLRAATEALREAARHLLRVERRLAARAKGQ